MFFNIKTRSVKMIFAVLLLLFGVTCTPQTQQSQLVQQEQGAKLSAAEVSARPSYASTASPERIILTWQGDPSTSQAVTWRTDTTVKKAYGQVAQANDGPFFPSLARRFTAQTTALVLDSGSAHYHSVNFTQLSPKTRYVYRVGDGTNWSEWIQFDTANDQAEPFTFIYLGDAQSDIKSRWSRVIRRAYSDAPEAAFMLHAGDLVNRAESDAEWGEWFYGGGFALRMMASIAAPGNHEYFGEKADDGKMTYRLSRYWRQMFAFPLNGPEGLEESAYWIDYQGARIIVLNSNEQQEVQKNWLEEVLRANNCMWTIVTFHHPIYSASVGRNSAELRRLWQPIFDKYHVDLVLQGHDHTYARSELMAYEDEGSGGGVHTEKNGTVYVVSVSGPKMYKLYHRPYMRRAAEYTQLYQIIKIGGDELRYEARTATGQIYDSFVLRKRPGQANELIERIPAVPERYRQLPVR